MNQSPALSVIIPVYNVEPYLAEALDCIVGQSFSDMEILCVNDGSTDRSPEILAEYAAADPRIRIIDQENQGLSAARNRGLEEARGEFVYYFDSDDLLDTEAFAALVPRMREDELDLLFFNVEPFADGDVSEKKLAAYRKYYRREHHYDGVLTGPDMLTRMEANEEYLVGVWSYAARLSFLRETGLRFEKGLLFEDNLFTLRAMLAAKRTGYMDRVFFRRRLRGGSITQSKTTFDHAYGYFRAYSGMWDAWRDALGRAREGLPDPETARAIADCLETEAVSNLIAEAVHHARKNYAKLDSQERRKAEELPAYERVLFSVCVEEPQILAEKKAAAERGKKKAEAARNEAEKQCGQVQQQVVKLQKKIDEIKGSKSYRLGEKLAAPVRGVRKLAQGGKTGGAKGPAAPADEAGSASEKVSGAITAETPAGSPISSPETPAGPKTAWFFGSPSHGNLGDHMIAEASHDLIRRMYPGIPVREIPRDDIAAQLEEVGKEAFSEDPVFYIGGGNLGNYWMVNEYARQSVIRAFPDNPKIVLPQSIQFTNDEAGRAALAEAEEVYTGEKLLLTCRGRASLEFAQEHFSCRTMLLPDTVMYSALPEYWHARGPRRGALLCLRQDKERVLTDEAAERLERVLSERFSDAGIGRIDTVLPHAVEPPDRRRELAAMYRKISGAEAVVTDRLHGMVFCAQTGTPCVVLTNDHHKIGECFEWLEAIPWVRMIGDPDELSGALEQVIAARKDPACGEYPLRALRKAFEPLFDEVSNGSLCQN